MKIKTSTNLTLFSAIGIIFIPIYLFGENENSRVEIFLKNDNEFFEHSELIKLSSEIESSVSYRFYWRDMKMNYGAITLFFFPIKELYKNPKTHLYRENVKKKPKLIFEYIYGDGRRNSPTENSKRKIIKRNLSDAEYEEFMVIIGGIELFSLSEIRESLELDQRNFHGFGETIMAERVFYDEYKRVFRLLGAEYKYSPGNVAVDYLRKWSKRLLKEKQ